MRIPSLEIMIWVFVLIGGAIYLGTRVDNAAPQFKVAVLGIAVLLFVIGILVLLRFRWSPELVAAIAAFWLLWAIIRIIGDGPVKSAIGMSIGAMLMLWSYPSLRREVRGRREDTSENE